MSTASRARNEKRPSPVGKRPRAYGELSILRPLSLLDMRTEAILAHSANRKTLKPRKGTGSGFGGRPGLSGMAPKMRRARRKVWRLAMWIKRDQAARAAGKAALSVQPAKKDTATAPQAKPAGMLSRIASKLFRRKATKGGAL